MKDFLEIKNMSSDFFFKSIRSWGDKVGEIFQKIKQKDKEGIGGRK